MLEPHINAPLCSHCRQHSAPAIRVAGRHAGRLLAPTDVLAAHSVNGAVALHLTDGETLYEYLSLKELLERYPDVFVRAARDWIVQSEKVTGYRIGKGESHFIDMAGLAVEVKVSRRCWHPLATRLGIRNEVHHES